MGENTPEPRAVTFALRKGGVGKTVLSINTAERLAARGHKVLLMDADSQGHATEGVGLREVYDADVHVGDYLLGDIDDVHEVIHSTKWFDVLPSNAKLGKAQSDIEDEDPFAILSIKKKIVDELLGDEYDFILIDSPATGDPLFSDAALVGAQNVIVPMHGAESSVRGVEQMFNQQIQRIRENMDLNVLALVPNDCTQDNELKRMLKQLNKHFREKTPWFARMEMWGTTPGPGIRHRVQFSRSWRNGVPLAEFDPRNDMLVRLDELADIVERGDVGNTDELLEEHMGIEKSEQISPDEIEIDNE